MESFKDYIAAVQEELGVSKSNIAYHLEIEPQRISKFVNEKLFPPPEMMMKLARRAGFDQDAALLWLASWKAKDYTAKSHYKSMAKGIERNPNWGWMEAGAEGAKPGIKKFGVIITLGLLLNSPLAGNNAQAAANTQFFEELSSAEFSHNARINKHYAIIDRIFAGVKSYFFKLIALLATPLGIGVIA